MSLVIPFLCIFNDLSESIPLKVKLSTIFILLRFISLQRQRVFFMSHLTFSCFLKQLRFCHMFYLQKLKLWKFEKSGWQHYQSVSVQLQDQQSA